MSGKSKGTFHFRRHDNRRLYCATTKKYFTILDVVDVIKQGFDIHVIATPGGEDQTAYILARCLVAMQAESFGPITDLPTMHQFVRLCKQVTEPNAPMAGAGWLYGKQAGNGAKSHG